MGARVVVEGRKQNAGNEIIFRQALNYYDFDFPDFHNPPVRVPEAGSTGSLNLNNVGSRLMNAVIRDGTLWTGHHFRPAFETWPLEFPLSIELASSYPAQLIGCD